MADIRPNSLPTTATSFNTDDYLLLDGTSGGTRKMLAANPPFTDVKFGGASGPSAKASIAARAARQGLVFDGTGNATVSVAAFASTDFSVFTWINVTSFSSARSIIGGGTGAFVFSVNTSGALVVGKYGSADLAVSTTTLTAGKWTLVGYVRSGTTGTYYIDGIAAGTTSDSYNYTAVDSQIGANGGGASIFLGTIDPVYPYNRALTAAEVVSLYESGVPAGSDYNTANNTGNIPSAQAAFTSSTNWQLDTGNSINTGAGTLTMVASKYAYYPVTLIKGKTYRITFTASSMAGTMLVYDGTSYISTGLSSSGSFTFTMSAAYNGIAFQPSGGGATLTSFQVYNVGLLLAPDAGQAGGGLTWYDTSGNAANITLPASGVSWNVPSSQKTATGWTFGGAVNATSAAGSLWSGSNSTALSDLDTTATLITKGSGTPRLYFGNENAANRPFIQSAVGGGSLFMVLQPYGGNVLVGGLTDGGQKFQVVGTIASTTNAANNALTARYNSSNSLFGVTINSSGQGTLAENTDASTGTDSYSKTGLPAFRLGNTGGSGTVPFWIDVAASGTAGGAITWTNAFKIDSSQSATFAGTIVPKASTGTALFALDTNGQTVTVANNATATPFGNANNFSGLFIINDTNVSGNAAVILAAAGTVVIVSQTGTSFSTTSGTASKTNVYLNASVVTVENKSGSSINYNITAIRTRNAQ